MTDAEKWERVIEGLSDALESYEMDDCSENAGDYVAIPPVLIDYALALLKAREPRVMTLEEVKALPSENGRLAG